MENRTRISIDFDYFNQKYGDLIRSSKKWGREALMKAEGISDHYAKIICREIKKMKPSREMLSGADNFQETFDSPEVVIRGAEFFQPKEDQEKAEEFANTIPTDWIYEKQYVYNKTDDKYVFITKEFGNVVKTGDWVRSIFRAYSRWDGDSATINEICRSFECPRPFFVEMKRIMGLTKDREPFTPEEVESGQVDQLVTSALEAKRFQLHSEYEKAQWKQTQKNAEKWENFGRIVLDTLEDKIPSLKIVPRQTISETGRASTALFTIADLHLGSEAKNLKATPDYNLSVAGEKLKEIVRVANTYYKGMDIVPALMGDLVQSISGMMHMTDWKYMEKGVHGASAIFTCVDMVGNFLADLGCRKVVAVTGNHGRLSANFKEDQEGQGELIIYGILKRLMPEIEWDIDDLIVNALIDDINYVIMHGHKKLAGRKPDDLIRNYANPIVYNVVLKAHLHHRNIEDDNGASRKVTVPAIISGDKHSSVNGWTAISGFMAFESNLGGYPIMHDYPLEKRFEKS